MNTSFWSQFSELWILHASWRCKNKHVSALNKKIRCIQMKTLLVMSSLICKLCNILALWGYRILAEHFWNLFHADVTRFTKYLFHEKFFYAVNLTHVGFQIFENKMRLNYNQHNHCMHSEKKFTWKIFHLGSKWKRKHVCLLANSLNAVKTVFVANSIKQPTCLIIKKPGFRSQKQHISWNSPVISNHMSKATVFDKSCLLNTGWAVCV